MAGNLRCLSCDLRHEKVAWGKSRAAKSHDGVLYIRSKPVLAPHNTLPGQVGVPQVGVWGYACNAEYKVSRFVLREVQSSVSIHNTSNFKRTLQVVCNI
jgi:hypothetical protein